MTQFYVYIYRDPSRKNEAIYVGKGRIQRVRQHLTRADMHPFTQRLQLMKANGVEPHIEIISAIDEDHAFFMEECCIQVLGRKDLGKGTLLNLTDGGEGARNVSVISKTKNSEAHRGVKNPFYGKCHSDKTKQAYSNARKGKKLNTSVIKCPHCGKEGRPCNILRYHFDNCKSRIHPAV